MVIIKNQTEGLLPVILEMECFSGENWVNYELIPKKVLPLLPNSLIFSMFCQLLVSSSLQPLLCPGPFSPLCLLFSLVQSTPLSSINSSLLFWLRIAGIRLNSLEPDCINSYIGSYKVSQGSVILKNIVLLLGEKYNILCTFVYWF